MGQIGPWQIIIVVVLIVLLFGRGKISELMGDVAKGIRSFRSGLTDEEKSKEEPKTLESRQDETAEGSSASEKDRTVNS